jgi:hypothetical protein
MSRNHYESIIYITMSSQQVYEACRDGNTDLLAEYISDGAVDWNAGLDGACYGGHRDIVTHV